MDAIRKYFSSAVAVKQFLLDLRLRTVMLAVDYEDGLARVMQQGAHIVVLKFADKYKDILIYGIRNKFPYLPLQLGKAETQIVEEFKAVHSARVINW